MALRFSLVVAVSVMMLGGCQTQTSPGTGSMTFEYIDERFVERNCPEERCAEVSVRSIRFPDAPQLTAQLQTSLLRLGTGVSDEARHPLASSWEAFAEAFFAEAKSVRESSPELPGYRADLEATIHARHDDLLIMELGGYVYTGGAHGMPLTEFMVIDERQGRVVDFDDMLIAGQDEAFGDALERAHERWLREMDADDDFAESWPLSMSHNVAPLQDEMVVKYNVYDIAPYAVGQPELRIPHRELEGVIAPRYLGK